MYSEFYGFAGRPFQLTPDPAFYFESRTHRKALSYLGYGLAQGEGFIVITGEIGAGKSTLAAHLMATIDAARLTVGRLASARLDGDDVIPAVAAAFGLAGDAPGAGARDKLVLLDAIEQFLHAEARAGRRSLLVVDEAQNLTIDALEELRALTNFQLGAHPLLQIVLLGQPEFRSRLQSHPELEQLRQRVIASHHLEALDPEEVERYVLHRLRCVGWQGRPDFATELFAPLHAASEGVPRRINQIVNRLLLLGAVEQRAHLDAPMLEQAIADLEADAALPPGATHLRKPAAAPAEGGADPPPPAADAAPGLEDASTSRDAQIAELQQAVLELAETGEASRSGRQAIEIAALQERLAALESRVIEQERALRHTLTMLIEWIECDETHLAAA
ncbi:MAG: AAA family ATPase [Sphingomonadales bacterium]|nr:AAA family ATPase [Sphingomonadales bacterium]